MVPRKKTDTVQLSKIRMREDLRLKLKRDADKKDVTLNAEIVDRLERSYLQSEQMAQMFGGERNAALFRSFAGMIGLIESQTGQAWNTDEYTRAKVRAALIALLTLHSTGKSQGTDPKDEGERVLKIIETLEADEGDAALFNLRKPQS